MPEAPDKKPVPSAAGRDSTRLRPKQDPSTRLRPNPAAAPQPKGDASTRLRAKGDASTRLRTKQDPSTRLRGPAVAPIKPPEPSPKKSKTALWVGVAILLLAAGGGGAFVAVKLRTKPPPEPKKPEVVKPVDETPKPVDIAVLAGGPLTADNVDKLLTRADEYEAEGKFRPAREALQLYCARAKEENKPPAFYGRLSEKINDLTDRIREVSSDQTDQINEAVAQITEFLEAWKLDEAAAALKDADAKLGSPTEFEPHRAKLEAMRAADAALKPMEAGGSIDLETVKQLAVSPDGEIMRRAERVYVIHLAPPILAEGKKLLEARIEEAKRNEARARGEKVPDAPEKPADEGSVFDFFRRPRWGTCLDPMMEKLPAELKSRERYLALYHKLKGGDDALSTSDGRDLDEFADLLRPFPPVHYSRALGAFMKEDFRTAEEAIKTAVELEPRYGEAWVLRARVATEWSQFDKAREYLLKAAETMPDMADLYLNRALILIYEEKKEEAKADLDFALKLDPKTTMGPVSLLTSAIAGPKFTMDTPHQHRSDHYVVLTDISPERAKEVADQLELLRPWYAKVVGKNVQQDNPVRVYVFKRRAEFDRYGAPGPSVLGWYHPIYREFVFYDENLNHEQFLHVMFHEGFHQYVRIAIPNIPRWLNEALAEYAASARVVDGKLINQGTIDEFLVGRFPGVDMGGGPNLIRERFAEAYYQDTNWGYAGGWTLIHFFFEYEGGRYAGHLKRYLDALVKGSTPREAHRASMPGTADRSALYSAWQKHFENMKASKKDKPSE